MRLYYRNVVLGATIACGLGAGSAAMFLLQGVASHKPQRHVWDLGAVPIPESLAEHQTTVISATLRNVADEAITCRPLSSRFGQMTFTYADGATPTWPEIIKAGSARTYSVHIRPTELAGTIKDQIIANVECGNETAFVICDVEYLVLPAWKAFPDTVVLRPNAAADTFVDVYSGQEVEPGTVQLSDEHVLVASLESGPKPYNVPIPRSAKLSDGRPMVGEPDGLWKYRFSIRLRCTSEGKPASSFGYVRVLAADRSMPSLIVRTVYE